MLRSNHFPGRELVHLIHITGVPSDCIWSPSLFELARCTFYPREHHAPLFGDVHWSRCDACVYSSWLRLYIMQQHIPPEFGQTGGRLGAGMRKCFEVHSGSWNKCRAIDNRRVNPTAAIHYIFHSVLYNLFTSIDSSKKTLDCSHGEWRWWQTSSVSAVRVPGWLCILVEPASSIVVSMAWAPSGW